MRTNRNFHFRCVKLVWKILIISVFYKLQPIDQTVCNASPSSPWIDVRTLLTCSHVPNTTFVPQIANLGFVTSRRTILVITLERFELFDIIKSFGISHPLNSLPCCHNPDIFHRHNRIKKQLESFLVVRSCKPCRMI